MSSIDASMLSNSNLALAWSISLIERKIKNLKVEYVPGGTIHERMAAGDAAGKDGFRKLYLKIRRGDLATAQMLRQFEIANATNDSKQKSIFIQMYVL